MCARRADLFLSLIFTLSVCIRCEISSAPFILAPSTLISGKPNEILICAPENATTNLIVKDYKNRIVNETKYAVAADLPTKLPFIVSCPRLDVPYTVGVHVHYSTNRDLQDFSKQYSLSCTFNVHWIQIETDKPIYRLNEEVKIRILVLNRRHEIYKEPLLVKILTPDYFIVYKAIHTTNQTNPFVKFEFPLPHHGQKGLWSVQIFDRDGKQAFGSKSFEVSEYALPNFKIFIIPSQKYYQNVNDTVKFTVIGKWAHGQDLSGNVVIKCSFDNVTFGYQHIKQLLNGQADFHIRIQDCSSNVGRPGRQNRRRLIVLAESRDYGNGEKQTAKFVVLPKGQRKDVLSIKVIPLKPGLTGDRLFPIEVKISDPNDLNIDEARIKVFPYCLKSRHERLQLITDNMIGYPDKLGRATFEIPSNFTCYAILTEVSISLSEMKVEAAKAVHLFPRLIFKPLYSLKLPKRTFKIGEDFQAEIRNIGSREEIRSFNYLVICINGYKDHAKFYGQKFSFLITVEMYPECVLALYLITVDGRMLMEDATKFFVEKNCVSTVEISPTLKTYKPGQKIELAFSGAQSGFAAVHAVDRKLEFLTKNWAYSGDVYGNFELFHLLIKSQTTPGINFFNFDEELAESKNACCMAGLTYWQIKKHCPVLTGSTLQYLNECQSEFTSCCRGTSVNNPTPVPSCQNGHGDCNEEMIFKIIIKSPLFETRQESEIEEIKQETDETIRMYFPEVWLYEEYALSKYDGIAMVPQKLPDSITTWSIRTQFYDQIQGICQNDDDKLSLVTHKEVYLATDLPDKAYIHDQWLAKVTIVNSSPHTLSLLLTINVPPTICSENSLASGHSANIDPFNATFLRIPMEFLSQGPKEIHFTLKNNDNGQILDQLVKTVEVLPKFEYLLDSAYEFTFDSDLNSTRKDYSNEFLEMRWINKKPDGSMCVINFIENDGRKNRLRHSHFDFRAPKNYNNNKNMGFNSDISPDQYTSTRDLLRKQRYHIDNSHNLLEILRIGPVLMTTVDNARRNSNGGKRNDQLLMQSKKLLQYMLMEMLSFRNKDGSFGMTRKSNKSDLWLTLISVLLQCRNDVDEKMVCQSLKWILSVDKENVDTLSSLSELKFTSDQSDDRLLFNAIFLLVADECKNYCLDDSNFKENFRPKTNRSLEKVRHIPVYQTDGLTLSATVYALSKWRFPSARLFYNHLLQRYHKSHTILPNDDQSKSNSFYKNFKRQTNHWLFFDDNDRRSLANQILANAFGILLRVMYNQFNDDWTEKTIKWLYSVQKSDNGFESALDTYFATEAIQQYEASSTTAANHAFNTTVELICDNNACDSMKFHLDSLGLARFAKVDVRRTKKISLLFHGKGAIFAKLRFSTTASPNHQYKNYPVKFYTGKIDKRTFAHEMCFSFKEPTLKSFYIEHGFPPKHVYKVDSLRMLTKNGNLTNQEMTSNVLVLYFDNLLPSYNHCYTFEMIEDKTTSKYNSGYTPMVLAKHSFHGTIGARFLYHEQRIPLLEKFCTNASQCQCLQVRCPRSRHGCNSICDEDNKSHVINLTCQNWTYVAIIKITDVTSRMVQSTNYIHAQATVYMKFPSKQEYPNLKILEILKESHCKCPHFAIDRYFIIIIHKDQLSQYDEYDDIDRHTVIVDSQTIIEPLFDNHCDHPKHQMDVMKLLEPRNFETVCKQKR